MSKLWTYELSNYVWIQFRGFMFDCPSGKLKKEKAIEMYGMILPDKNAFVFVDHIFRIFDKDNNEEIDFKESLLIIFLSVFLMLFL